MRHVILCTLGIAALAIPAQAQDEIPADLESLKDPRIITRPAEAMLVVEATGDPTTAGAEAFGLLFQLYYGSPVTPKGPEQPGPRARWPVDFAQPRSEWLGIYALPVPAEMDALPDHTAPPGFEAKLTTWEYGEVAEILHVGPYTQEEPTLARLREFVESQGYVIHGPHEEEYIRGPTMAGPGDPEQYLTILRYGAVKAPHHDPADARPLWHDLQPGTHPIGFRLVNAVDNTRNPDRVVRIAVWYPASAASGAPSMTFGDYLEASPDAVPDSALEAWWNGRDRQSLGRQFFDEDADSNQAALMAAAIPVHEGVEPAAGPFPLVLHSLGRNGNQFQHSILWEYLASHGFVVASVGQFGADLDHPEMEFTVDDLSFQLQDMESALNSLLQLPYVDASLVGVLGHSSGAVVGLWLAALDSRVSAVGGLDGSTNRAENQAVFLGGLEGRSVSVPFLNICRWPHEEYDEGFAASLSGPLTRIGFERAIHFDFQNWPAYQAFAGAEESRSLAVRSVDEATTVFESTALVTRLFLEAQLKSDSMARSELEDPGRVQELSDGLATLTVERP